MSDGIQTCKGIHRTPACTGVCRTQQRATPPQKMPVYAPLPDLLPETLAEYGIIRFQVGRGGNVVTGYAVSADGCFWHRLTPAQRIEILTDAQSEHHRKYTITSTQESRGNASGEGWYMVGINHPLPNKENV